MLVSLLTFVIVLAVLGLILYLITTFIPMDPRIKTLINLVVVVVIVIYLIYAFLLPALGPGPAFPIYRR